MAHHNTLRKCIPRHKFSTELLKSWPPSCLCRLPGAAQQAPGCDHSHTAPAGYRRCRNKDRNPLLALGQASRPCVLSGYGDLSVLPPRLTADHCRHHAGINDYPHSASSPAGIRPTSHCSSSPSPRDIRVRRSPRQRGSIGEVRAAAVSFTLLHL